MMNLAPSHVRPALAGATSLINACTLGRISPSAYLIRPVVVRSLGCMPRNLWTNRAPAHLTKDHPRSEALFNQQLPMDIWKVAPNASFSSLASMRFHPLFSRSPLFRIPELLHPIDFPQMHSPRYEITDNEEKFEIAVDVPGMTADDLKISVDEGANLLSISGQREASKESYKFSSSFSQSFSLDPDVDLEKLTANLENGILTVSAPKDLQRLEDKSRSIPITTTAGTPLPIDESDEIESEKHEGIVEEKAA